jgi:phage terminase large subunit
LPFIYTTAIKKLRKLKKRIKVVPGGSSAGKTFGIIPILIDKATKTPFLRISVVSGTLPQMKKGSIQDFKDIMRLTNRWYDDNWHETNIKYTFSNRATIEFFSADDSAKLKGPRRDVLYINECDRVSFESYGQLVMRTDSQIWLDFNPSHRFWVHDELPPNEKHEWLTLTYLDNEGCPKGAIEELEGYKEKSTTSKYWMNKWRVYGLGELGSLDGVVFEEFKEWDVCDSLPNDYQWRVYGLDFGYTNDPSSLTEIRLSEGILYFKEHLYSTGMTNKMISDHLTKLKVYRGDEIFADSAEPKSIDELYGWGWNIKGATKGRDSISQGIDVMKRYPMRITNDSVNLIREVRKYAWAEDKEGNKLMTPVDKDNHAIDSVRYGTTMKLGVKQAQILGTD